MPSFLDAGRKASEGTEIHYTTQDINKPFSPELQGAFDLTHVRYVLAGGGQAGLQACIKHLASSLAPGGWLQVQELKLTKDPATSTPAMDNFLELMRVWICCY